MKPYSPDLRRRIFNYSLTHPIRETARHFQVSASTVQALRTLFTETASLAPRPRGAARPRSISPDGELYLQLLLRKTVDLTLTELCTQYAATYGVTVSLSTMHATLKRLRITRKRKATYDRKKTTEAVLADTEDYHRQIDPLPLAQRLYLDETGTRLNMTLPYGRSPCGERVVDEQPVSPGQTVNTVAVLTEQGLAASQCYRGALTAERFLAYLEVHLLPLLLNGNKTLILDRHPVHRARRVRAFLDRHHLHYVYLPPYSPELNPIEEAWSQLKHFLKRQKPRTLDRLLELLQQAKILITPSDAKGYLQHAEDFSLVMV